MVHQWILRLHVGIFMRCIEARTILRGIQVVVTDYHGAGVTPMEVFEQLSQGSLLFRRSRVGGLTSDVEPALVADAYRVGVMVHAVGANLTFRTAWLYLSVTTDDVVVADALKSSVFMPLLYVLCR